MAGVGEAATATVANGITTVGNGNSKVVSTVYYDLQGARVSSAYKGVVIKVDTMSDGQRNTTRVIR